MARTGYPLLDEFDGLARQLILGKHKGNDTFEELPEDQQMALRTSTDQDEYTHYGVTYQRCGGGRRIIRRTGGN